jgi:hypothetical protein
MPVSLPDIVLDATTVEIRGVAVPVRGFTLLELGQLIATKPAIAVALNGNMAALLGEKELLEHAIATCADLAPDTKLRSAEQAAILKEIVRLTVDDAVGPFVDLAASMGGAAEGLVKSVQRTLSRKTSSPPTAGSVAPGTSTAKS